MSASCTVVVYGKDGARYLTEALAALGQQHLDPGQLQVVITDQGSTDRTRAIVDEFTATLPGIAWVDATGLSRGQLLQRGVASATGTWLTFQRYNDVLPAGFLGRALAAPVAAQAQVLVSDVLSSREFRRQLRQAPLGPAECVIPAERLAWAAADLASFLRPDACLFRADLAERGLLEFTAFTAADWPKALIDAGIAMARLPEVGIVRRDFGDLATADSPPGLRQRALRKLARIARSVLDHS